MRDVPGRGCRWRRTTRAVQLDRFCADVDIAIGVNVSVARRRGLVSRYKVRALAEAAGLKLGI